MIGNSSPKPSPQSFQRRCAKLAETGNLNKASQLATSTSVQTSLSAPQRIALLQNKHPARHTTSFTAREIETVTSPTPDPVNTLPGIISDIVLHYLSDCYNPIPPADALLYISHLTSFLNLLRIGTLPQSIIALFRDGHLICIHIPQMVHNHPSTIYHSRPSALFPTPSIRHITSWY
jgi:hypothetical protein